MDLESGISYGLYDVKINVSNLIQAVFDNGLMKLHDSVGDRVCEIPNSSFDGSVSRIFSETYKIFTSAD